MMITQKGQIETIDSSKLDHSLYTTLTFTNSVYIFCGSQFHITSVQ